MVRKLVAGIRRYPLRAIAGVVLLAMLVVLAAARRAEAATYSSAFYAMTSAYPGRPCDNCGCEGAPEWVEPGINVRTGTLRLDHFVAQSPGRAGPTALVLTYGGELDGYGDFGYGITCNLICSVEKVIIDAQRPESAGGHEAVVRLPSQLQVVYTWDGSQYSTASCCYHSTLSRDGSGNYVLTDLDGGVRTFHASGMIASYEDRNGNELEFTFSGCQWTSMTDTLGKTWTIGRDQNGFADSVTLPSGAVYAFEVDSAGNLVSWTTPETPDQEDGISGSFTWDGYHRLTEAENGRAVTPWTYSYVGSSRRVYQATGSTVSMSYTSGRTDITDRNGNVRRYHWTGDNVTKVEHWIGGASAFATEYRYNGSDLVTIVRPRGNRIDFTRNGSGFLTERRQKTTDTSQTDPGDIVESWGYTSNFLTSYTDPLGRTTTYGRDSAGNMTSEQFPNTTNPVGQSNVSRSWSYNQYGQVTEAVDEEGRTTAYEYWTSGTWAGLLRKVRVDPDGLNLTTETTYDAHGGVASVIDPLSHTTTYDRDALGRVVEVTDPLGARVQFHMDGNGNVVQKDVENLDEDGASVQANPWFTTTYTYGSHDQRLTITEEIDASTTRTTEFQYDANLNRTRVIKPEANEDAWTYNSRDLVATHVRGDGSAGESTTTYSYDDNGNLIEIENGRSKSTTFAWDLFDRRTKVTNALGHYEETDYDKAGHMTDVRRYDATPSPDVLLQRSTRYCDERGRLWRTSDLRKDPGTSYSDAVTTVQRFKTGHVRYVTDPRSKVTETQYDYAWRATKTIDAMGNEVQNTWDAASRRTAWSVKEMDGQSSVTHDYEADFDDAGRMVARREIDRNNPSNELETLYGSDSRGNVVWIVNAKGDPTRFTFDGLSRMIKKEVALSTGQTIEDFTTKITTEWAFDDNNRLVSFKDDAANESTWAHDALDRPTSMTYPDDSAIAWEYDLADNVVETTDAAGNVIADTFDDLDRLTEREVTLATGFVGTTGETREYDALNRLTAAEDDDYRVEFTYGVLGLGSAIYEETQEYAGGTAYTKTVTTTIDAAGNLATMAYPGGLNLAYAYNDVNRVSSISDGTNTIASFSYIGMRPKVTTFQSGATATYSYTGYRGEIDRVHHQTSQSVTLVRMDYGYDQNHDRTWERFGAAGSSGDAFEYDKAERLTKAWMGSSTPSSPSGNSYVQTIQYNMDDDGNRSSVVVTPYGQSAQTTSYTDNNLNQYTAVGGTSQSHDGNGNLTNNGTHKFKYDYRNQLCEVRTSSDVLVATYRHDALGRRVEKDVASGTDQRYVYAGVETIEIHDLSGNLKQSYVFGQGIDHVLMLEQADILDFDSDSNTSELTRSFYHRNALGSVMTITDMNQAKVEEIRYTPYGEMAITRGGQGQSSDPLGQHWAFTARFLDEETGLYHYRARAYDPAMGRFLQRDPRGYARASSLFEYAYCSPANHRDSRGLEPDDEKKWLDTAKDLIESLPALADGVLGWASSLLPTLPTDPAAAVDAILAKTADLFLYSASALDKFVRRFGRCGQCCKLGARLTMHGAPSAVAYVEAHAPAIGWRAGADRLELEADKSFDWWSPCIFRCGETIELMVSIAGHRFPAKAQANVRCPCER